MHSMLIVDVLVGLEGFFVGDFLVFLEGVIKNPVNLTRTTERQFQ